MKGVWGRYALVDLSTGRIEDYEIPSSWYMRYLGGRGIGTRILIEETVTKGLDVDPLGESNLLIFGTGPLQGTGVPGAGRHIVMGYSPKTGTINESYAGGFFAHELGTSGFDGLIIRGVAEDPSYIEISNQRVQIHPANDLWGLNTGDCEVQLKERHGEKARIACIGQAGEQLVQFACIVNDRNHAAGRPGWGAVMGAKKLKAIVVKGAQMPALADPTAFKHYLNKFIEKTNSNPSLKALGRFGTAGNVLPLNGLGILPTKNFQMGSFASAEAISGEHMADTILVGKETCIGCPVRCRPVVHTWFADQEVLTEFGGPEYETIASLGSLCLVDDLSAVALANQKCNQYGIDTISVGVLMAFLMEATERGLISKESEMALTWGDASRINTLIDAIGNRTGIGDVLAKGVATLAKDIGGEDFALHIKEVELPAHDPRGKKGLAISYATSPRGATHLEAIHDHMLQGPVPTPELDVTSPSDPLSWEGKPRLCKIYEDLYSFVNSSIICGFLSWDQSTAGEYYPFPEIRGIINAITGFDIDVNEMMKIGERNYITRRIVAANSGYTIADDGVPKRLQEALQNGACEGETIPDEAMKRSIAKYYELRGFDAYGPTDARLEKLACSDLKGMIKRQPEEKEV